MKLYLGFCISTVVIYLVIYTYNIDIVEVAWNHAVLHFNTSEKHPFSISASTNYQQYSSKINFTWIDNHPIYKRFYIKNVNSRKRVSVLVVVSTAPKRIDRRNAIRKTWWKQCVGTGNVIPECIFITDFQGPNDEFFHQVQTEVKEYDDIYMQLVEGGVSFGKRFLYHMLFAEIRYQYDYFVRIDDDQMFCLNRFLTELPMPPIKMFHWGWVHTTSAIRRPEESIILLSQDLIEIFLLQPVDRILCHPLADQMIASWLTDLNITKVLRHDSRIHHGETPVHVNLSLMNMGDLCNAFIAIHGVYSDYMEELWSRRGETLKNITHDLKQMSMSIPIEVPFNWQWFHKQWRYEPKLCITNPSWNTSKLMPNPQASFAGRQEGVGMGSI